jgi:hypothetical protein
VTAPTDLDHAWEASRRVRMVAMGESVEWTATAVSEDRQTHSCRLGVSQTVIFPREITRLYLRDSNHVSNPTLNRCDWYLSTISVASR